MICILQPGMCLYSELFQILYYPCQHLLGLLSLRAERFLVSFLGHVRREDSLNMKVKFRFVFSNEGFQVFVAWPLS